MGEIEATLLDAVLGIRYGRSHNGVRGAIARWRTHRADPPSGLDDLRAFLSITDEELARILQNKQKASGRRRPSSSKKQHKLSWTPA